MISTISQPPSTFTVPPSQNTAPVNEFRCLYTHDIQRKKKRWQDGFLKFHTFNKRVMVYDTARNFVGDLHWKDVAEVQEGVELELDIGVLVEVTEKLGTTTTNLAPIFQRKANVASSNRPRPTPAPATVRQPIAIQGTIPAQMRHKPLASLLGTPTGRHGRAMLPIHSPYTERHGDGERQPTGESARKRQRIEDPGQEPGWSVTRVSKPAKNTPLQDTNRQPTGATGSTALRSKKTKTIPHRRPLGLTRSQKTLAVKEVIDIISSDSERSQPPPTTPTRISTSPRSGPIRCSSPGLVQMRILEVEPVEEFVDISTIESDEPIHGPEYRIPPRRPPESTRPRTLYGRTADVPSPDNILARRPVARLPRRNTKPIRLVSGKQRKMLVFGSDNDKASTAQGRSSDPLQPPQAGDEARLSQELFDFGLSDDDGSALQGHPPIAQQPPAQPPHNRNAALSLSQEPTASPKTKSLLHRSRSDISGVRTRNTATCAVDPTVPLLAEVEEEEILGPWSIEALYLFDWRPPGFTEEQEATADVAALQRLALPV